MNLPEGWESGVDSTGRTYYVNHKTQQTQWEFPTSGSVSAPPPDRSSASPPVYATAVPGPHNVQVVHAASTSYGSTCVRHHPSIHPSIHPSPGAVTQQPGGHTVVVVQDSGARPPPNAPPGGQWIHETHCGLITLLIAFFIFPCICCCPCDHRLVYVVGGQRYNQFGAPVGECC
ncbi:unnamed protein product [Pylaiella littoralis]